MKFNFLFYIIPFFILLSNPYCKAQNSFNDFKKEKTYIQTNHVFYKPGEIMFYKIYVIQAENNLPADQSRIVNFELVDPSGAVVKKDKFEIKKGHAEGSFYFGEEMKGGIYKIRAFTAWMQNEAGKNVFEKEITLQKIVSPRILMKLDFPKKGYGAGDEVVADFSMRSLSNLPIPFYEAYFTVMHQGEKINEGSLITDKEGKFLLKFKLPEVLKSSDALLNIKVNFDGFTESISRNIPIVLNNLDVKFMPEGGTFINGIEQNIAFKVLDEFEKSVDAMLEIYNQNHQKLTETSAYNFGMGSFLFTPKKGETYYAKVLKPENISKIYSLPIAKDEGIVFNAKKENQNIRLIINSTFDRNVLIKGNFRGKEIFSKAMNLKKGLNELEISEKELPIGICRFTVIENNIPLAERIVFSNENKQMKVKITPTKKNYLPREKVIVNVETTDENDQPVPANLAMSVVDDKLWTYADDKQNHIISWLLMDSELRGKIERPQFYFDKKEEKALKSLDLVMLTNGYRYFEMISDVIKSGNYKYLPEKKNPIYGIVEDENKEPVKAEVYLIENYSKIKKQMTSENGLFYFSDLAGEYQHDVIAKSLDSKQKVKIRMLSYKLNINPLVKQSLENINVFEVIKEAGVNYKNKNFRNIFSQNNQKVFSINSDTISRQTQIESVTITGYRPIFEKTTVSSIVKLNTDLYSNNILSKISGQLAGVNIMSGSGQPGVKPTVVVRGISTLGSNTGPLYIIDGFPANSNSFRTLSSNDINNLTILKDAAATSIYGNRGANGVIIINSKNGQNSNIKFDITPETYFVVKNIPRDSLVNYNNEYDYNSYRKFSYPVYESTNTSYRHDYRETLYWNPVVETDKNGKAQIEFYQSDANSAFRIMTEGISASGLIGRDETTYAAQSLISIDAKIPQYVTRTDQMTIPVVIKNNSSETKTLTMNVIVPNHIKLIKADSLITLKPLESGRLFVKMQTDKLISSNIQFTVKCGDFRETMILPLKVEEKGFPYHFSIINNKSENTKINIPDYINTTLEASYYVYENSASQMFEDMERLKREPYGCFEQLSSTVYPNIFILDYLKSTKKINAYTESESIRNMKKGYQKMLSYKNSDGGFSYFGGNESDVALSAFALMEFRDLKKYVAVDTKLIQNLSAFILSKKGANDLFEVRRNYESKAEYSEYSWSRNMYILYALSKIGFKSELQSTFEISLKRALATKDSYQLALMANAAANLGKNDDYNNLMTILNEQYINKDVKTKTTFTGSQGISANAETLSLYMMALQKNENANQLKIAEVADELINYNGYYGFGSTQATTVALEALSDFFAKNEKLFGIDKPTIKINNVEVLVNNSFASAFKKGENDLSVEYLCDKGLPYKLDYQYYTLEAPKSENIPITLETKLKSETSKVGETNRMTMTVKNKINGQLPMTTAKIGIPAGLTLQNALLKDLIDKKQISYYEIFDNYLVLYWEHFDVNETKTINLDLKVEFAGEYTGKASNVYLYYMPESKFWNEGIKARIEP
ncbi:TonB-dependent receptor plug domain-containing protein [Chryseobacterium indoltheticum]|uniref:Outer membrane cobalamin receptor protein n=1 Tax=Chryseobacterium indoltheticum TaxID=254 RepID=A0A381F4P4_9FLAO|nr:alpha-2-macroglobulin family protein [Chryseobacterium indoltheticum]SIQ57820.1 TonB-dependent outer membrane receptor, SusC/RagA subfamily, signature region [Chryseobacterium indoltheticum]SUX41505.1 Outer membrane cobalamin receptor protein [Chryseobacterium indoltheticum]